MGMTKDEGRIKDEGRTREYWQQHRKSGRVKNGLHGFKLDDLWS